MRKAFSFLFALLGILVLTAAGMLCFRSLNAPAELLGPVESAKIRTEELAAAVTAGDYAAAGKLMYGQPDLALTREPSYAVGELLWEAYQESLRMEFSGECRATDSGIARDVTITAMDISTVMKQVKEQVNPALDARAEAAENKDLVFDEKNAYREDFVMETLYDVTRQILETDRPVIQRNMTLELVLEDGQWWILPEQGLIRSLSGVPGKGA